MTVSLRSVTGLRAPHDDRTAPLGPPRPGSGVRRATRVLGAVAGLAYAAFVLVLLWAPGAVRGAKYVSELEMPGGPYAVLLRSADVLAGVATLALAAVLWRSDRLAHPLLGPRTTADVRRVGALVALVGTCSVVDGLAPMACDGATNACDTSDWSIGQMAAQVLEVHTTSAVVGVIALVGAALAARRIASGWQRHWHLGVGAGVGLIALAEAAALSTGWPIALLEQVRIVLVAAWLMTLPLLLGSDRRHG